MEVFALTLMCSESGSCALRLQLRCTNAVPCLIKWRRWSMQRATCEIPGRKERSYYHKGMLVSEWAFLRGRFNNCSRYGRYFVSQSDRCCFSLMLTHTKIHVILRAFYFYQAVCVCVLKKGLGKWRKLLIQSLWSVLHQFSFLKSSSQTWKKIVSPK